MELDLVRIFVKVVQNGSFTKAADLLKVPKSTVSKSLSRLEQETGTKLLLRTTRSLTLTAAGRVFYESSLGPIQQLEDAQKSLYGQDSILSGLVRMTAPEDLGNFLIAPAIAQMAIQNPKLSFELHCTDEVVDLVKDGFDLAVRLGRIAESSFKVKKVGEIHLVPVASPLYLKNREKVKKPAELSNLDCLSFSDQAYISRWTLRSSGKTVQVPIRSKISSNQMSSLLKSAIVGGGVAFVPIYLCADEISSGVLVRLLPDWMSPGIPVSIISPLASHSSARLKITSENLFKALSLALRSEV